MRAGVALHAPDVYATDAWPMNDLIPVYARPKPSFPLAEEIHKLPIDNPCGVYRGFCNSTHSVTYFYESLRTKLEAADPKAFTFDERVNVKHPWHCQWFGQAVLRQRARRVAWEPCSGIVGAASMEWPWSHAQQRRGSLALGRLRIEQLREPVNRRLSASGFFVIQSW